MQLHRLEMTAIGPYAGTEVIDFARLGQAGLFLLEGPTGSGKSTIIDAITFGLYGRVAQASADVERIHSHHADPRTVPVVTLVFETQSGLYRVQRTPRFERPKSRGTGTTTQQPSVKLWRIATPDDLEGGELLSTNIGECDDEITRAVGLTRDQFVQTVILPQGEFATFLRARSEEKGKLLEKVFGTAFFRRVQDSIVEAGKAAQARRQGAMTEIRDAVHSFAVSAGLDDDTRDELVALASTSPQPTDELSARLDEVVDELSTRERHARKASREAVETHRQMADAVNASRLRMQRRERLLALQRQDEELRARVAEFEELALAVERARQARPVAGAMRTLAKSEAALRQAGSALKAARARVAPELQDRPVASLREAATQLREVIGSLTSAIALEAALGGRIADRQRHETDLRRSREERERLDAEVAAIPASLSALEQTLASATRLHALLDARRAETVRAKARLDAAVAHTAALARVPAHEEAATEALAAVSRGEAELGSLRQARIDDIAGELGLSLRDGEPCPVCGSAEHPAPARPTADAVTPEQVEDAEQQVRRLREVAQQRAEALSALRGEVRERAATADGLGVEQAREAAEVAGAALAESLRAEREVAAATTQLADLRRRGDALTARAHDLGVVAARLEQQVSALDQRIAQETAEVETARDGHESVAARRSELASAASLIDALVEATGAHEVARAAVAEDELARDADLAAAGFSSVAEWMAADRPAEWVTARTR